MENTIGEVRDGALGVGRPALASRSADLTCIFRGIRSEHDTLRFWFHGAEKCPVTRSRTGVKSIGGELEAPENSEGVGPYRVTGVSVRYFGPKQRHSMEVRSHGYTIWITVDAIPGNPGIYFASLLYWYVRASEAMPKGVREDHFFCSQKALKTKGGRYHGLVSVSLANIMKRLMTEANIPAEFLPHSARAAGMAQGKTQGMTDDEVCIRSNVSRPTYTKLREADSQGSVSATVGHHLIGAWVCGTCLPVVVLGVNLYPRTTTWRRVCSLQNVQTLPEGLVLGSSGPTLMGSPGSGGGVWTRSKGCFFRRCLLRNEYFYVREAAC